MSTALESKLQLSRALLPNLLADGAHSSPAATAGDVTKGDEMIEIVIDRQDLEEAIAPALALVEKLLGDAISAAKRKMISTLSQSTALAPSDGDDRMPATPVRTSEQPSDAKTAQDGNQENPTTPHQLVEDAELADGADWIDEVVLVGGCSRMPAIQAAVVRACQRAGIQHVRSANHLCMSQDPETVVAMGLGIQGARLSGIVEESHLADLIVFDCLPRSIGLAVWEEGPVGQGEGELREISHHREDRIFEPLLLQGTKLPASVRKQFRIASSSSQRSMVTLEIYEEFEVPSDQADADIERKYSLLMAVDVPIEGCSSEQQAPRTVDVIFTANADQTLSYRVVTAGMPLTSPNHSSLSMTSTLQASPLVLKTKGSSVDGEEMSRRQSWLLMIVLIVLLLIYLIAKASLLPITAAQALTTDREQGDMVMDSNDNSSLLQVMVRCGNILHMAITLLARDIVRHWANLEDKWQAFWRENS